MADAAGDEGQTRGSRLPLACLGTLCVSLLLVALGGVLFFLFSPADGDPGGPRSRWTMTRIGQISGALEQLRSSRLLGRYPTADAAIDPGETNAGIEAAHAAVHDPAYPVRIEEEADAVADLDGDGHPEYVDLWGNPLVSFAAADYERAEVLGRTRMADGRTVTALPRRGRDGRFLYPKSYQILSAGPDGEFGTEDDLTN